MVDELENAGQQGSGTPAPATPATTETPVPVIPSTKPNGAPDNWEDVLNGFKGAATKQTNRANSLAVEKQSLFEQKSELEVKLQTETTKLAQEKAAAETRATQAEARANAFENKEKIGLKIRTEHPVLADLWNDGLLNLTGLEGEALDTHLKSLSDKLGTITDIRQDKKNAGSVPPPPPQGGAPTKTVGELQAAVNQLAKEKGFNSPEYRAAHNSLAEALIEQGKPK